MASYSDPITVRHDIRINPTQFTDFVHTDDSKLPTPRKNPGSIANFKKHYKSEHVDVPKSVFSTVECDDLPDYTVPTPYIRHKVKTKEEYYNEIEYEHDEEDLNWIELANIRRQKKNEKPLSIETMELVMDRLEKESHFEVKGCSGQGTAGSSFDADDTCCICNDGDVSNVNQIIYCDLCNIAVHQECYGVPYIPEGQWLCRKCKLSPSQEVKCCLCPNAGGAYKQTADGRWAHVMCAIWLNEVHFGNAVFLEPIEGVDVSLKKRCKLTCLVCRKKMGACLQCSTRSCIKAFHVTCAQQSGMSMRVQARPDESEPDGMDVQRFIYCHLHDDDSCDAASRKKRMNDAIKNARRSMAANINQKPTLNMPVLSKEDAQRIAQRAGMNIDDVLEFWYSKRKSRCGVPLIKRLQATQVSHLSISHEVMDEDDRKFAERFSIMRRGLETARLLWEQVKKREVHKRNHLRTSHELLRLTLTPVSMMLSRALERIADKDKNAIFAVPVSVAGYRTIIKHPMDISTMRKHLADGKYCSVSDLQSDFVLMMDNCDKFNRTNEYYLRYGQRLRRCGLAILEETEDSINQMEKLSSSSVSQIGRLMFYESDHLDSPSTPTEKEEQEERTEHKKTSRRSAAVVDSSPSSEKMAAFATPQDPIRGSAVNGLSTPRSNKRRRNTNTVLPSSAATVKKSKLAETEDTVPNTPQSMKSRQKTQSMFPSPATAALKRSRKGENEDSVRSPFRQASITKFLAASPVAPPMERRSAHRPAAPAPFMLFRDNSVTSPLAADVPSSESSADEDELRPSRRSLRLGDHAKMDIREDPDGFQHNDLVAVHGIAGRVIDPVHASLEEHLPPPLLSECRHSRKDGKICVVMFGTENKWGWYPSTDIRPLVFGESDGLTTSSVRLAKQWYRRVLDVCTK